MISIVTMVLAHVLCNFNCNYPRNPTMLAIPPTCEIASLMRLNNSARSDGITHLITSNMTSVGRLRRLLKRNFNCGKNNKIIIYNFSSLRSNIPRQSPINILKTGCIFKKLTVLMMLDMLKVTLDRAWRPSVNWKLKGINYERFLLSFNLKTENINLHPSW